MKICQLTMTQKFKSSSIKSPIIRS